LLVLLVVFEEFRSAVAEGLEDLTLREIVLDPEAVEFVLESEVSAASVESADPRPTRKAVPQLTAQAAAKSPFFEVMA
jgi:hypothetical protein